MPYVGKMPITIYYRTLLISESLITLSGKRASGCCTRRQYDGRTNPIGYSGIIWFSTSWSCSPMGEIFISLKPRFATMIEQREKDHEFRQYNPKRPVSKLWTYVSGGESDLRYIIEIDEPIEYPDPVPPGGIGNEEFNAGDKESTFAFPITHLHRIEDELTLSRLRAEFDFYPPQRYTYIDQYPALVEHVRGSTQQIF